MLFHKKKKKLGNWKNILENPESSNFILIWNLYEFYNTTETFRQIIHKIYLWIKYQPTIHVFKLHKFILK